MTVLGFTSHNHPGQMKGRGALDEIDDRGTDPELFAKWNERFGPYTVDAAAAPHNAKVARFFSRADDGLIQSWAGERVWCNPPYSDLYRWVEKAWQEWPATRGITMLLPANRTEQPFWQQLVEPLRDRGRGLSVEFIAGRIRFVKAGQEAIKPNERPPFGCVLLLWTDPQSHSSGKEPQ